VLGVLQAKRFAAAATADGCNVVVEDVLTRGDKRTARARYNRFYPLLLAKRFEGAVILGCSCMVA
jgi:hypothetical protein